MAAITVYNETDPKADSTVSAQASASIGSADTLANDGETSLVVIADGTNRTVTLTGASSGLGPGLTAESSVITVNASKVAVIGPFPLDVWGTSITVNASNSAVVGWGQKTEARIGTAADVASVDQLAEIVDALLGDSNIKANERKVYKRVRRALTVAHRRLVGYSDNPADHL